MPGLEKSTLRTRIGFAKRVANVSSALLFGLASVLPQADVAHAQSAVATSTALHISPGTGLTYGDTATLEAVVSAPGAAAPTGQVEFKDGDVSLGVAQLQALGLAVAEVKVGDYTFTRRSDGVCALTRIGSIYCWGNAFWPNDPQRTLQPRLVPGFEGGASSLAMTAARNPRVCAVKAGDVYCWDNSDTSAEKVAGLPVARASSVAIGTSLSGDHVCAIVDGGVWCWGANNEGQIGDGTLDFAETPKQVIGLSSGVTHIAAGETATCAVVSGAAKCWGYNFAGRVGDGSLTQRRVPTDVVGMGSGVTDIATDQVNTCAVRNGAAWCWGSGSSGALGNGNNTLSSVPVAVTGLGSGVSRISVSRETICAIVNGSAYCWGYNQYGAVGDGTEANRGTAGPVLNLPADVTSIDTSGAVSCVTRTIGTVACWGAAGGDAMGRTFRQVVDAPVQVQGISGLSAVTTGNEHSCAIVNGGAWCWGNNNYGQLGFALPKHSSRPLPVTGLGSGVTAIAAGDYHTCALVNGGVRCWGGNFASQLGDGGTADSAAPVVVGSWTSGATSISVGGSASCAVVSGAAYCWGEGYGGENSGSTTPASISGLETGVTSISTGGSHSCAVQSGSVKCWGLNLWGQVGNDEAGNTVPAPEQVIGLTSGATAVSAGMSHTCAIVNAQARCWGRNERSTLGNGSQTLSEVPVPVSFLTSGVTRIVAGVHNSCAIANGEAWCWGSDLDGMLGQGSNADPSPVPIRVTALPGTEIDISLRGAHTCAISSGSGYCWGLNFGGQTGLSPALTELVPNTISGVDLNALGARATLVTRAIRAGDRIVRADYAPTGAFLASDTSRAASLAKADQTIALVAPADRAFAPNATLTVNVSATSGLPVTLSTAPATVCSVAGATLTIRGAGECQLSAEQAGDDNFNAAEWQYASFTIGKAAQTIAFTAPSRQVFTPGTSVALAVSASSALTVQLTSTTPSVCTISGRNAVLQGPGTCTITASQPGNGNYLPAASVTRSFAVKAATDAQQTAYSAAFRQGPAALAPFGTGAVMAFVDEKSANSFAITVQRLTATGARSGAPIAVTPAPGPVGAPDVAALANGGFVVVWSQPDASVSGVFAQRFDNQARKVGGVITVSSNARAVQTGAKVAALPGSGFAVVWQSATPPALNDNDIMIRRFNSAGVAAAPDARVNTATARNQIRPDIATLPTGETVVGWATETRANAYGVAIRLYRATGLPLAPRERLAADLDQSLRPSPALAARIGTGAGAALRTGFVLAYEAAELTAALTPANIAVRTLSPTGVAGAAATANSVTAGHQSAPALATLRNGAFAVAFMTPDGTAAASSTGIGLRLFGTNATPLGTDTFANSVVTGAQTAPALAPTGAGAARGATFLGAWTTPGLGANGADLAARRFQGL